ncbi:ABC transporter ATP-binding protein [Limobrevibacterium gyesilva]|uniref:ABC transporter ATP-binding protein n=1 Tax=Limobrevibacterium gyesilva TaxID=2991712 RepID=A0AA41YLB0_9PROT|nr:ABC transporter ATP-binding protein [Limobrevibacterium gyesilva]MCW3474750.1 ABC transporter ATP-binding protein [Limobrevibacterium gyesilva]
MTGITEAAPLLVVDNLVVSFGRAPRSVVAARGVSFEMRRQEVVALVGESGSGKSTTGLALLGLVGDGAASVEGSIRITRKNGMTDDVAALPERRLRQLRGNDVAMIFQEPMSSLNPIYTIGTQIIEALTVHRRMSQREARGEALSLLTQLGVASPEKCLVSYPHQLSGGMRQRVMIAMALSGRPALLIADEPTTALDVTIQAQIIDILKALQHETGMAILFVTHDLGLVSELAERVLVMYAGQIVEEGPVDRVFAQPRMPYTQALMRSRPRLGGKGTKIEAIPGTVPNLAALPQGCSFHPRCPHFLPGRCDATEPPLEVAEPGWKIRCIRWRELEEGGL